MAPKILDTAEVERLRARCAELKVQIADIQAEARHLDDVAAHRSFNAEEQREWDAILARCEPLEREVRDLEIRELEMLVASGKVSEVRKTFGVGTTTSAYDSSDPTVTRARQVVADCRDASDAAKEAATRLLESEDRDDLDEIAEHVLRSTNPSYVSAFRKYLRNPEGFRSDLTAEEAHQFDKVRSWWKRQDRGVATWGESRAAMSLTAANGGVLVPQFLDPTIVLTNAGSLSDVRRVATVVPITTDQFDGVTSAGVTAEWLAEGSEAADATPTFEAPTVTAHKCAAWLFGSYEVIADAAFDEVANLVGDAFDRLEASAFINGTGSGQPYGLVTRLSGSGPVVAGTSGDAGAADLTLDDVYALDNALGARWRANAKFLGAKPTYNSIRQLAAQLSSQTMWADVGNGLPPELIGYAAHRAEDMDTTVVSGSNDYVLILGDFKAGYRIADRIGTTLVHVPMVMGDNKRPTFQSGWAAFKRVGADITTSNAFKVLKL